MLALANYYLVLQICELASFTAIFAILFFYELNVLCIFSFVSYNLNVVGILSIKVDF